MKQSILLFALLCATTLTQAQIGIGTNTPDASSQLDISSTSRGLLPPRMTALQRNSIANPAAGLIVWCNDCGSKGEIQIYDGTEWVNLIGGTRQMTAAVYTTKIGADIDGEDPDDYSGRSVAISSDGTTVAIGAPNNNGGTLDNGQVRVYENMWGTWTQIGGDIDGEALGDQSGTSVAISSDGTTVAIGAPFNDGAGSDAGQVRVYQNMWGTWTQIGGDIDGEAAGDQSGTSVAISSDGNTVAIGAPFNDGAGSDAGQVRVYQNIGGTWTQIGGDIDGEALGDQSGYSVDISSDGTTVAIGAPFNDGANFDFDAGQVRVYQNIGGTWTQIGVDIDGEALGDQSGYSVAISSDGTTIAIGAPFNDGAGSDAGQVRVYQNIGGTWMQFGGDIDGEAASDQSGYSVAISSDGNTVAIGAPFNDGGTFDNGQVRAYQNGAQIGGDIDGEAASDQSGYSVAISSNGNTVAIGAPKNDGFTIDNGQVRVYLQRIRL
jgi:hypothetical protein